MIAGACVIASPGQPGSNGAMPDTTGTRSRWRSTGSNDAVVVGAGPNGLVAAITLASAGWNTTVLEASPRPGGGTRSEELTLPGVIHDVCSAIHPLGLASPALRSLPLDEHGLEWVHPDVPLAHPLDDGRVALLHRSIERTAAALGPDASAYRKLFGPFVRSGFDLTDGLLSPLAVPPEHPITLARFGVDAIQSARRLDRRRFVTDEAGGLFAGLAAHSVLPLESLSTAGFGLMLGGLGHMVGWPMAAGGSQSIATALVGVLEGLGGTVQCDTRVTSLDELPRQARSCWTSPPDRSSRSPAIAWMPGTRTGCAATGTGPGCSRWTGRSTDRSPGRTPRSPGPRRCTSAARWPRSPRPRTTSPAAATLSRPFVLLAQQSLFDPSRAPSGVETAWAYCHVPNGSTVDMTERIEAQVERFAPGFRDRVIARHTMSPAAAERHNANYVGGDIGGGAADLRQFVARPTLGLHPWATPVDGLYLCSSSTPPGGGVHGMCGWHAAREVMRRQRRSAPPPIVPPR